MPALQSSAGFRNHHNRTSLGQPSRSTQQHNAEQLINGSLHSGAAESLGKQTIGKPVLGSISKGKGKPDKPYQSETYRVLNNASSQSANQTQQSSIV